MICELSIVIASASKAVYTSEDRSLLTPESS